MRNCDVIQAGNFSMAKERVDSILSQENITVYKVEIKKNQAYPYYTAYIDWEDNER